MLNRRVGNTGSEPTNPRVNNRIMPPMPTGGVSGGGAAFDPTTLPVLPARPPGPRGMKKGGKVGSSCMKKGGAVKSKPMAKYASGGMVKADGCAVRGKTKGKNC